jgi:hypothetical protein
LRELRAQVFMPALCPAIASYLVFLWPDRQLNEPLFRKEATMLTTVNPAAPGEQPITGSRMRHVRAGSRNRRKRLRRYIESLPRAVPSFSHRIAAGLLRASLGLLALAAIFALQAAFYVYVWRLPR